MLLNKKQIEEMVPILRNHLIPCWTHYHEDLKASNSTPKAWRAIQELPTPISSLTCRHTTAFLRRLFRKIGVTKIEPVGGYMRHKKKIFKENAELWQNYIIKDGYIWSGHYWILHNDFVIDITKDQFGYDASEIQTWKTARRFYQPDLHKPDSSVFSSLARTIEKFEGKPQTFKQKHDPFFKNAEKSYQDMLKNISKIIQKEP